MLIDNNIPANGNNVHNGLNNHHLIRIIETIFKNKSTFSSLSIGSTLFQVSKLIVEKRINQIITYNYDNYIEETVRRIISGSPSYFCNPDHVISHTYDNYIKRLTCINNIDYVNIYHVHGLINLTGTNKDKTTENIILSEDDYYSIESKVYNWVNSVQVKAITSSSALFVGFSATDYNFRRIMKHCSDQLYPHYIIFNLNDYTKKVFPDEDFKTDLKALNKKYLFELAILNQLFYSLNTYWKQYNIKPIWCPVNDISKLIEYLYT